MTRPLLFVLLAYLWGAIPASWIAGKMRGIDLRRHGSGNLGATNTFRVLGAKVAAPVMVFDILKGLLPVVLFSQWDGSADWRWELAYGAAAIVGHVFSIYMRFRGGKGVATSAGVMLAEAPVALGVGLVIWLVVLRTTRMVSAASIAAALAVLGLLFVTPVRPEMRILGCAVCLFVIFAHRANIQRIRNGTESRFGEGSRADEATVGAAAVTADGEEAR
ncbi:glycerol-3-phosphate 1-O-acyltransferase PlsY [Longimicrobium sp.]|uniref:glycerol-3-phosphate 1-O-acyltransferase PlsY n=1 Tax=Longimicrobium sp. TaxID=2029185 RepID=UPI002BA19BC1|nr:glycerol-3-phosphate 1-O-acyltransferase PlsY [Longimicrobium sp.]HSU14370.1 glycerol-3-phosphate 1-O-acyltransferase PlsY [Longimicrobium sp.]